eukprot:3633000-Lingulodinium_polyedra.AAC.1
MRVDALKLATDPSDHSEMNGQTHVANQPMQLAVARGTAFRNSRGEVTNDSQQIKPSKSRDP